MKKKHVLISVSASLIVPFLFWLHGFNFDKRGDEAMACVGVMILAAFAFYTLIQLGEP